MRLYTFEQQGSMHIGVERDGRLMELGSHRDGMIGFIAAGRTAMAAAVESARQADGTVSHAFDSVRILAPIPRPGKILCSGMNYRSHVKENPAAVLPATPFFFAKVPTAVIGPGQPIVSPGMTRQLDYEVELAVVIGRKMKAVPEEEAMQCVAGYTILQDISARDVQFADHQITLGKNFDTFSPMGPCLVTADEIPDPAHLSLRTYVNGTTMQDGSTADWIFPLPFLLSFLSRVMTLEPGDVVSTGTPAGVGYFRSPAVFLKPGDVVRLEIERIGILENPVVAAE